MVRTFKFFGYCVLALIPGVLKIKIYNRFLKAEIDKTARIGLSPIIADKIKIGPGVKIGHFTMIRGLSLLDLGAHVLIGRLNIVSAVPQHSRRHFNGENGRFPALIMGAHSAITARHFLDCSNTVTIGHHTTLAGLSTAVLTHGINIVENRQESAPVAIGNYCMISAKCTLTKGTSLPDYSVLGAGSVLHKAYTETHTLYSGVPAVAVKKLDPEAAYFHRENGYVT